MPDEKMFTRKIISLSEQLATEIDDYRFSNRIRSEAEAIRRLIELGLQADRETPEKQ